MRKDCLDPSRQKVNRGFPLFAKAPDCVPDCFGLQVLLQGRERRRRQKEQIAKLPEKEPETPQKDKNLDRGNGRGGFGSQTAADTPPPPATRTLKSRLWVI